MNPCRPSRSTAICAPIAPRSSIVRGSNAKVCVEILIVEESLANLTGTQTRISIKESPIQYLRKVTDLFKPSNNSKCRVID